MGPARPASEHLGRTRRAAPRIPFRGTPWRSSGGLPENASASSEALVPKRCRCAEFSFLWTSRTIAPRHATMSTPFFPLTAIFFSARRPPVPPADPVRETRAPSLTVRAPTVHNPPSLQRRRGHETHLSAEQPPPQEDARLPGADEHQERAPRSETQAGQGAQKIYGVKGDAPVRPQDRIRQRNEEHVIYDKGQES